MSGKIYTALGLMSGTSLDGVDGAVIRTDGEKVYGFGASLDVAYSSSHKNTLAEATQAALRWKFSGPKPNSLLNAQTVVDRSHIKVVSRLWLNSKSKIDVIGYHGQTMVHLPPEKSVTGQTLQIGDGQKFADKFDVPCIYDFRTADVEAGGQGAPLAPIYHKALCKYSNLTGNTIVLNLGGVGNFTWIGAGPLMASDTGPANGPLDTWLESHGKGYDKNGEFSRIGNIDFGRIDKWIGADFFQISTPKSADRYDFDVMHDMIGLSLEDGAATLAAFCALSVKKTLSQLPQGPDQIIVCGGGRKNTTIMNMLRAEMSCSVKTAEDVGWQGDFIEAQAFAYLAVRSKLGLPISFPETTGAPEPMTGGRIAYPK